MSKALACPVGHEAVRAPLGVERLMDYGDNPLRSTISAFKTRIRQDTAN